MTANMTYLPNKILAGTNLGCLIFIGVFLESYFSVSSEFSLRKSSVVYLSFKISFFFLQRPRKDTKCH